MNKIIVIIMLLIPYCGDDIMINTLTESAQYATEMAYGYKKQLDEVNRENQELKTKLLGRGSVQGSDVEGSGELTKLLEKRNHLIDSLQTTIKDLEGEVQRIKNSIHYNSIEDVVFAYRDTLDQLRRCIEDNINIQRTDLEELINSLRAENDSLRNEIIRIKKEFGEIIAKKNKELEEMKMDLDAKTHKLAEAEETIKELERAGAADKEQIRILTEAIKTAEAEIEQLKNDIRYAAINSLRPNNETVKVHRGGFFRGDNREVSIDFSIISDETFSEYTSSRTFNVRIRMIDKDQGKTVNSNDKLVLSTQHIEYDGLPYTAEGRISYDVNADRQSKHITFYTDDVLEKKSYDIEFFFQKNDGGFKKYTIENVELVKQ